MRVHVFTFNPFQENTYVVYDESGECIIIDAGCHDKHEQETLVQWLAENQLTPVKLVATHSHLDHAFGNDFVCRKYTIPLLVHQEDVQTLQALTLVANMYGIPNVIESPQPSGFIKEGKPLKFGNSELEVRFVPGHAPGHVVFVAHEEKFVINGDCLFAGSIGRTDLPGGNHQLLLDSIQKQLFTLPDDYVVHCGHGPTTTIGREKMSNPFF
jgi:hydroxyacylglutathione hydrolase